MPGRKVDGLEILRVKVEPRQTCGGNSKLPGALAYVDDRIAPATSETAAVALIEDFGWFRINAESVYLCPQETEGTPSPAPLGR